MDGGEFSVLLMFVQLFAKTPICNTTSIMTEIYLGNSSLLVEIAQSPRLSIL